MEIVSEGRRRGPGAHRRRRQGRVSRRSATGGASRSAPRPLPPKRGSGRAWRLRKHAWHTARATGGAGPRHSPSENDLMARAAA